MMISRSPRHLFGLALCLVIVLFSTQLAHAGTPSTPDRPPSGDAHAPARADAPGAAVVPILTGGDFAGLSTEAALELAQPLPRDLADMALRLNPNLDAIPHLFNDSTPVYNVGDRLDFWVQNSSTAQFQQIVAELVHKTDAAYAWVEVCKSYDKAALRTAVDHFSSDIYPVVRAVYGAEASPGVDTDPRLHILNTSGLGPGVAGYFLGGDRYSNQVLPHSNQKELFFMSLDWARGVGFGPEYEEVLAHEFQHMIHANHDSTEQAWVNEGLSEYAKVVAGYPALSSFAGIFAQNPGTQLNDWGGATANNAAHYGAAFVFMHYLAQRFGDAILGEIVAEPGNGLAGINAVLQRAPYSSTVEAVFGDWVVANAVNTLTPDDAGVVRWGYPDLPQLRINPTLVMDDDTAQIDDEVANFATDYILLKANAGDGSGDGSGDATPRMLRFVHRAGTALTPMHLALGAESENRVWWSNRVDSSETRLTRHFDLSGIDPGAPITATVRMWFDIEPDYDYGYVMASADGVSWTILPGQYTTDANPSGMNLGDAYTGAAPESESPDVPVWIQEQFDLSAFAGGDLWLRFDYVTDDAVTFPGWIIDDVAIPALGYSDTMDGDADGWESEGWVLGNGALAPRFLVQAIELIDGEIASVRQIPVDEAWDGVWEVGVLSAERELLISISGIADGTTEPALYSLIIE